MTTRTRAGSITSLSSPTNLLRALCRTRQDIQKTRLACVKRGSAVGELAPVLEQLEHDLDLRIMRALKKHVLWPWLSQFPGLRGVAVARLIAIIGNPHRFPGRRCTVGHYLPYAANDDVVAECFGVGDPCPVETMDGPCSGTLLPPRPGSGVRALQHFCGQHVVNGRSPRRARGVKADWNLEARSILMMPNGIADQIVRSRTPIYRAAYDAKRASLQDRAVDRAVIVAIAGAEEGAGAGGLRPFQIHHIAKTVAVKQFLGDLLIEWKRLAPSGEIAESAEALP